MGDDPLGAASSQDSPGQENDSVASADAQDSPEAMPSVDAGDDVESLSGSVTIILNPRWQREVANLKRLGQTLMAE